MQAELQAMEAQYKGLQTLVGELLMTNQKLREEVAALRQKVAATSPATHPQPRQDH
jgi:regulator of replication initiation timing